MLMSIILQNFSQIFKVSDPWLIQKIHGLEVPFLKLMQKPIHNTLLLMNLKTITLVSESLKPKETFLYRIKL